MKLIQKLERKFGRYAIHDLMKYIIVIYGLGFLLGLTAPGFYDKFLALNIEQILKGQVWRLVTFVLQPYSGTGILFLFIELYFYYMIGTSLEKAWGTFRFNLYYFTGILFNIVATFLVYFISKAVPSLPTLNIYPDIYYVNRSMFFAFAVIYPNVKLLLMFIIPIKVKWIAILYGVIMGIDVIRILSTRNIAIILYYIVPVIAALLNFLIFFFSSSNMRRISPQELKRKTDFRRKMQEAKNTGNVVDFQGRQVITRHKCAICGRTELDDDNLEFRFCSKCDGNYEYCMDHLFTHEHVNDN